MTSIDGLKNMQLEKHLFHNYGIIIPSQMALTLSPSSELMKMKNGIGNLLTQVLVILVILDFPLMNIR